MSRKLGEDIRARRIGKTAKRLLEAEECAGQVLAVVSNAIYLTTRDGELLWLASEGTPAHARGISIPFAPRALNVGMRFATREARLRIGGEFTVDLQHATEWTAPTVAPGRAAPLGSVNTRVRQLRQHVAREFNRPARLPVGEIARACVQRDVARLARESRALIGLGEGLTPSGDDFLGGLLFVLHHLKTSYPDEWRWDMQPIAALLDRARARTNRISHAILADLARGDGPEPLHDLIVALLTGAALEQCCASAARLARIGSTSGWDILSGALNGFLWVRRSV